MKINGEHESVAYFNLYFLVGTSKYAGEVKPTV